MKKVPTYFERDWNGDRSRVVDQVNPECQWVADGEGWATQKIDGACAQIKSGRLFKRRELRAEDFANARPPGFELADHDALTGKVVGWVPVGGGPEDQYFREAFDRWATSGLPIQEGTYELVGPKVQGNPEGRAVHGLVFHGGRGLVLDPPPPRDFEGLRAWMTGRNIEGVVWHHRDGRMAKLKVRDFGIKRAPAETSADDGAPTRHTLSAPAEPKPEPQDEAIGGLIERLQDVVNARDDADHAFPEHVRETCLATASALSRLQVERDELGDVGRNMALQAERLLEALRDGGVTFDHQRAHASMVLAREVTAFRSILFSKRQQLTSSQSQPCSETGPNSPSSPQTPFSDGEGEPTDDGQPGELQEWADYDPDC